MSIRYFMDSKHGKILSYDEESGEVEVLPEIKFPDQEESKEGKRSPEVEKVMAGGELPKQRKKGRCKICGKEGHRSDSHEAMENVDKKKPKNTVKSPKLGRKNLLTPMEFETARDLIEGGMKYFEVTKEMGLPLIATNELMVAAQAADYEEYKLGQK